MASKAPTLSKQAAERLERLSKTKNMTPSQVILKLLPEPDDEFEKMLDQPNPQKPGLGAARKMAVKAVHSVRKTKK